MKEETVPGTEKIWNFMYAYFLCLQLLFELCRSGEKCQSLFLQKFWTCLGVQYFALLLSFLRQTDNRTGIKIQNNPYILK